MRSEQGNRSWLGNFQTSKRPKRRWNSHTETSRNAWKRRLSSTALKYCRLAEGTAETLPHWGFKKRSGTTTALVKQSLRWHCALIPRRRAPVPRFQTCKKAWERASSLWGRTLWPASSASATVRYWKPWKFELTPEILLKDSEGPIKKLDKSPNVSYQTASMWVISQAEF